MANTRWTLDAGDGELLIHTGVTGRAAKMGHRLTIAMRRWHATVDWNGDHPATVELTGEVDSLEVIRGDGGVTALSAPEKALARSNALKSLQAGRFPEIRFAAEAEHTDDGYRLTGTLHICATTREHVVDVDTADSDDVWRLSSKTAVCQSDFGVRPYSLLMGSVRVADEVVVSLDAARAKDT